MLGKYYSLSSSEYNTCTSDLNQYVTVNFIISAAMTSRPSTSSVRPSIPTSFLLQEWRDELHLTASPNFVCTRRMSQSWKVLLLLWRPAFFAPWSTSVVFNVFLFFTPKCNLSSTFYLQRCWYVILFIDSHIYHIYILLTNYTQNNILNNIII
jgi:hypothetical protein